MHVGFGVNVIDERILNSYTITLRRCIESTVVEIHNAMSRSNLNVRIFTEEQYRVRLCYDKSSLCLSVTLAYLIK